MPFGAPEKITLMISTLTLEAEGQHSFDSYFSYRISISIRYRHRYTYIVTVTTITQFKHIRDSVSSFRLKYVPYHMLPYTSCDLVVELFVHKPYLWLCIYCKTILY